MVGAAAFCEALRHGGVGLFTGVPDSLLAGFCAYVADHVPAEAHVVAANEGNAVALAAGHHLATGELGLVYLQNSGLGNAVNPLVSLADPSVYGIPMILLVGWRGEPDHADEPQHVHQGRTTLPMLDILGLPHAVLPTDEAATIELVAEAVALARERSTPYALVVRRGTFASSGGPTVSGGMVRERAVAAIADALPEDAVVVATTGKIGRELYAHRGASGQSRQRDFLSVGSMGHASHIALGIAMARPEHAVYCLDGDGAALMHLGALTAIGTRRPANLRHLLLNNGAHDSVGGQPTVGFEVDFVRIALACGYPWARRVATGAALLDALGVLDRVAGPAFLEVRVAPGARPDLGRPAEAPVDRKRALMAALVPEAQR